MFETISLEMADFIQRSPSCYHAVSNLAGQFESAGFTRLHESRPWELRPGNGYFFTRSGSALIAFRIPEGDPAGFMIAAAHSDAPAFKVKPVPELAGEHYVQLNVEQYGGAICSAWLDRPLSTAGRVTLLEGDRVVSRLVNLDRDLLLIPNLAIHMNRKINEGVALNPQVDMLPLFGQENARDLFWPLVAQAAGASPEQILSADLFLYLREDSRIWGAEREFLSSPRLDDLQCAWACAKGLLDCKESRSIPVCAVFDNEEVGSAAKQGADSSLLQDTLLRISTGIGRTAEAHQIALASSMMASADNGHAIHPNHPEKADKTNHPHLNGGVVIKHSANQKYTTDSISSGLFQTICQKAEVPVQVFTNRSDVAGGSTLGNLSNKHVSLNTVDIGLAQLAMHSPYETGGVKDTWYLLRALTAFYQTVISCDGSDAYTLG